MCLRDPRPVNPPQEGVVFYKVMKQSGIPDAYDGEWVLGPYLKGEEYLAEDAYGGDYGLLPLKYPPGFHGFVRKEDAQIWAALKKRTMVVECVGTVVTMGAHNTKCAWPCVVASKMTIVREVKRP